MGIILEENKREDHQIHKNCLTFTCLLALCTHETAKTHQIRRNKVNTERKIFFFFDFHPSKMEVA